MASWTLVSHHRGGVCRAEETTEKTSGEEGAHRAGKPQLRDVGQRWLPGLAFHHWPQELLPTWRYHGSITAKAQGAGRGVGVGLKWLKLQQKRPRFEIRNDSVIPNKEIKSYKER